MKKISPHDNLLVGTEVRVGVFYGRVVSVRTVPAVPSGLINIHKVTLYAKRQKYWDNDKNGFRYFKSPVAETTQEVNYSFIMVE